MKRNIKMIGLDMDGTLLTDKKELTAYTKNVLKNVMQEGVIVLPATGRPRCGIPQELIDELGVRYAVTANGARILDLKEEKALYEKIVPLDMVYRILDIFDQYDAIEEIYFEGVGYIAEEFMRRAEDFYDEPAMVEYIVTTRKTVPNIRQKLKEENRGSDKVQGIFKHIEDKQKALEQLKEIPGIEVTGALKNNIEVNIAGVDKGEGLLRLGKILGIRQEEIMACGDGLNDISMLKAAGLGVAVANAEDEVKAAADYIAESNNEDGVAKAVEKFVCGH